MATATPLQPTGAPEGRGRRRERHRLAERGIVPALGLLALGGIFLMQNLGRLPAWGTWWALFLLIPAAGAVGTVWTLFHSAGHRLTPAARRSALGAAAFTAVAALLLVGWSWRLVWPVVLLVIGLEALASRGGGLTLDQEKSA